MANTVTLLPGLYDIHGRIGFLGYQTKYYAHFVELYDEKGEGYCCKGSSMRHPAAGMYVKKTTARKLKPSEITKEMNNQWNKRIKEACGLVWSSECKRKT